MRIPIGWLQLKQPIRANEQTSGHFWQTQIQLQPNCVVLALANLAVAQLDWHNWNTIGAHLSAQLSANFAPLSRPHPLDDLRQRRHAPSAVSNSHGRFWGPIGIACWAQILSGSSGERMDERMDERMNE